jgi:hypothetical protein
MGSVYLARERVLERLVAIKVLAVEIAAARDTRERFRREARVAARLTHPGIVPLHAFGETDDLTYFVMGYVPGESLGARLKREGRIAPAEARRIVAEVADALGYAHRQGVVHRDVKPDNVLLDDETGRALLADFGLARTVAAASGLTAMGTILGTPHYMSPEQASGHEGIDHRTDLYSLGVTAYAMLSGRLPFEGRTAAEVLAKHLTQPPPPLGDRVKGLPESLTSAVMRCLAKDPSDRWPGAQALRVAIAPDLPAEVPEDLAELGGVGFWLGGASLGAGYLAWIVSFWRRFSYPGTLEAAILLLAVPPLLFAVRLVLLALGSRRHGRSWREVLGAAAWPPHGWPWFPAAGRRPTDVWPRLPLASRALRSLLAVALILCGLVVAPMFLAALSSRWPGTSVMLDVILSWGVLAFPFLLASASVALLGAEVWGRLHGLRAADRYRVMFGSTRESGFWKRPDIVSLLEDHGASRPVAGPDEDVSGHPTLPS